MTEKNLVLRVPIKLCVAPTMVIIRIKHLKGDK